MHRSESEEIKVIEDIIVRQFASLTWTAGSGGNWDAFAGDFFAEAALYPAARPAKRQDVGAFIERMKGLQATSLKSLRERLLGTDIRIFGNVATAVAACEITENDTTVNRGVEMLLLIKSEGQWRIVAQAWDSETPERRIPTHLLETHA